MIFDCRYSHEWEKTVKRSGRWIDFENDYKTLNLEFMETVWWVFAQIFNKGLVYRGMKVMPYSWKLSTTISNNEASENYKNVSDPAIMVSCFSSYGCWFWSLLAFFHAAAGISILSCARCC